MGDDINEKLKKKVSTATRWSFVTELVAKLIVPITNSVLAHLLSPESFGIVVSLNLVISFTDVLTESGFGQYLIQHDFKDEKEYIGYVDVAFWSNFIVSFFIWLIITIFRDDLAKFIGSEGYGVPLVVACISIPITSFSSVPIAMLQKKLDYKSLFYNRLAGSLTPLIVSTILAVLGLEFWALIIGTICSNIVKAIVLIVRSKWHPHLFYSVVKLKKMFSYSIWILLEAIAVWACTWGDVFIVSRALGDYYTGLYKTAQTTVTGILSVVTASVNSIVFVTLAKFKNDMDMFRKWFYTYQKGLAIIVVPMGFGILVYKKLITYVLLGTKWMEAAKFLGIWGLCMAMVATMGTFCREALRAKGFPKASLIVQILHLAFIIPIVIIGTQKGFDYLIYIRSFAYLQSILLLHIFAKVKLNISPTIILKNTMWPAFSALIMAIVGEFLLRYGGDSVLKSFIYIAVCVIVYFMVIMTSKNYRNLIFETINKYVKISMREDN